MYCKHCGHEINENAVACTNCGIATERYMLESRPVSSQQKANGFAIAGMICAIVGLLGGDYLLCLPSIVGIILGIVGMVKVKEYKSGFGFALTGIILGAVSLLIWLMVWMFISTVWYSIIFIW